MSKTGELRIVTKFAEEFATLYGLNAPPDNISKFTEAWPMLVKDPTTIFTEVALTSTHEAAFVPPTVARQAAGAES